MNPIAYVEIPVTDLDRAIGFYEAVFQLELERQEIDGYAMALFPAGDGRGAAAALAKGDVYVPSRTGPILYFHTGSIDATLARAMERGATILYPKKDVGAYGFVAEFADSEGNRIAVTQPRDAAGG